MRGLIKLLRGRKPAVKVRDYGTHLVVRGTLEAMIENVERRIESLESASPGDRQNDT